VKAAFLRVGGNWILPLSPLPLCPYVGSFDRDNKQMLKHTSIAKILHFWANARNMSTIHHVMPLGYYLPLMSFCHSVSLISSFLGAGFSLSLSSFFFGGGRGGVSCKN